MPVAHPYTRTSAATEEPFVVFILGLRVNRWRAVGTWRRAMAAMPNMLTELRAKPELGMLRADPALMFGGIATVQYWRSYKQLTDYSRQADSEHLPASRAFNRAARSSDAVGIWHETYRITPGAWETVYGAMPPVGLRGAVGGGPISSRSTSRARIGDRLTDPAPVAAPGEPDQ